MTSLESIWPLAIAALCVWREARGEPYQAKLALARILRERAKDPRWPDTLDAVATQPKQFSCFNSGDPNAVKFPRRNSLADWQSFIECWRAVEESESLGSLDGANHYFDISLPTPPAWAAKMQYVGKIGRLVFYRG